ncbi:MAG: hypothetical protein HYU81_03265 [Candidatus Brennerbacteria bacterium]|nr:hypothetical protein [Candidatus Brennerbacteria bacterium]
MSRGTPTLVILTFLVLTMNHLASVFGWYTELPWFDMVMHALGGAWIAAIAIVVGARRFPNFFGVPFPKNLLRVVIAVLAAGALWEVYELGFAAWATAAHGDLGFYQPWTDTASDFFFDAAGAAFAGTLLLNFSRGGDLRAPRDRAL